MHPKTNKRYLPAPRRCMFIMPGGGGCPEHAGHGRFMNFCEAHADYLAEIRSEMAAEMAATKRWGGRGGGRGSRCCTVGCDNPRVPPDAFCDDCVAAGAVEETA